MTTGPLDARSQNKFKIIYNNNNNNNNKACLLKADDFSQILLNSDLLNASFESCDFQKLPLR